MNPTIDLILSHRSIRQFTPEPVSLKLNWPAVRSFAATPGGGCPHHAAPAACVSARPRPNRAASSLDGVPGSMSAVVSQVVLTLRSRATAAPSTASNHRRLPASVAMACRLPTFWNVSMARPTSGSPTCDARDRVSRRSLRPG